MRFLCIGTLLWTTLPVPAASVYTGRIDDPKAAYLTAPESGSDATESIQAAIDKVQEATDSSVDKPVSQMSDPTLRGTSYADLWSGGAPLAESRTVSVATDAEVGSGMYQLPGGKLGQVRR